MNIFRKLVSKSVAIIIMAFICQSCAKTSLMDPAAYLPQKLDSSSLSMGENTYSWSEEWFNNIQIDHFSYTDNRTFALRYLINTTHFTPHGPIFFYTGNEGDIEAFAKNTGFMWDCAPIFNAAVIFAEHRFYGKTLPLQNESFTELKNLGYLSSEQALADYVELIVYLKSQRLKFSMDSPVIAFGGSYGGMLAAWMRIKYPHIISGSIASSAPVFWFPNTGLRDDTYAHIVRRSFGLFGCNAKVVFSSWLSLAELGSTESGRQYLNELFKLEKKSELRSQADVGYLKAFIEEVFDAMAMVNYPYPSNFLAPLPGWPVKVACKYFDGAKTHKQHATALYSVVNLYYNYTKNKESFCINPLVCNGTSAFGVLDAFGWTWQACTEMVMQNCRSGLPNDFFQKTCPFSLTQDFQECRKIFAEMGYSTEHFRPFWAIRNYGSHFPTASNIIFSNGYLDPWSGGGWSLSPKIEGSLVSIIIKDGAHHYDLRGNHEMDTDAVKAARKTEMLHISKWIKQAEGTRKY